MYLRVKDYKMINPEDLAVVLTMDHFVVSSFDEEYSTEHRMRDSAVEFGLQDSKIRLELEEAVDNVMAQTKISSLDKYRVFGLWLIGAVKLTNDKLVVNDSVRKRVEAEEEEEEEPEVPPLPPEPEEVVEKKRKEYIR